MYLEGTNTVNGKTSSIRMSLLGSQHSMIAFDVFVDGTQYLMAPIFVNFDHTAVRPILPLRELIHCSGISYL